MAPRAIINEKSQMRNSGSISTVNKHRFIYHHHCHQLNKVVAHIYTNFKYNSTFEEIHTYLNIWTGWEKSTSHHPIVIVMNVHKSEKTGNCFMCSLILYTISPPLVRRCDVMFAVVVEMNEQWFRFSLPFSSSSLFTHRTTLDTER